MNMVQLWMGLLLFASAEATAGPKRVDVKAHSVANRLTNLLESNGWIPVGKMQAEVEIGAVLIETAPGTYEEYFQKNQCFDASSARQRPLISMQFSNQLRAGVSANLVVGRGTTDVDAMSQVSFSDPVQTSLSTYRNVPQPDCVEAIRVRTERGVSFSNGFVVSATLRARVSAESCQNLEAKVSAGVGRVSTAFEACRSESSRPEGTVIGYKRKWLYQVYGLTDIVRAPSVGSLPDVATPPSNASSSSRSAPPRATRGVPTRGNNRSSSRRRGPSGPAPAPSTAGRVLQQVGYQMQRIAANTFQMGSSRDEFRVFSNAETYDEYQHRVSISKSYMVGKTEVTQRLYERVMNQNPTDARYRNPTYPVLNVSWADAVRFCNQLSRAEGFQAAYRFDGEIVEWDPNSNGYRLLTEAEWENAARARDATIFAGSNRPEEVAWIAGTGQDQPRTVGGKRPNGHGLFDMSGNAFEWVWDAYDSYPRRGTTTDPVGASGYMGRVGGDCGASSWDHRVGRGGSWKWGRTGDHNYGLGLVRVSGRAYNTFCWTDNDMGFRIGRTLAD